MAQKNILAIALVATLALSLITIVAQTQAEAKIIKVKVKAHFAKVCRDIFYLRMADNTRDPVTGEHKGLIWKTPYFTATKSDYSYIVNVDTKKAPSGRIVTYQETHDGLANGQPYNKPVAPPTEELSDQYIHQTLKKGLTVNFNIPALC
jgi:hypothetical protein